MLVMLLLLITVLLVLVLITHLLLLLSLLVLVLLFVVLGGRASVGLGDQLLILLGHHTSHADKVQLHETFAKLEYSLKSSILGVCRALECEKCNKET